LETLGRRAAENRFGYGVDYTEALRFDALIREELGDYEGAINQLDQAIAIIAEYVARLDDRLDLQQHAKSLLGQLYNNKANVLHYLGRNDDALVELNRAIDLQQTWHVAGDYRYSEGLATFRRKNPRSVQAEDWLGGRENCTDGQV